MLLAPLARGFSCAIITLVSAALPAVANAAADWQTYSVGFSNNKLPSFAQLGVGTPESALSNERLEATGTTSGIAVSTVEIPMPGLPQKVFISMEVHISGEAETIGNGAAVELIAYRPHTSWFTTSGVNTASVAMHYYDSDLTAYRDVSMGYLIAPGSYFFWNLFTIENSFAYLLSADGSIAYSLAPPYSWADLGATSKIRISALAAPNQSMWIDNIEITAVPEPSNAHLFVFGIAAMGGLAMRRRIKSAREMPFLSTTSAVRS